MSADHRPNIVFLFTDDQRFDTIGALGNPAIRTPNMDRLVRRGVSFTNAYIPGGSCDAVCMPSRAMVHTGRTLFHLDGSGESIPEEHTLMGEAMQAAGYRTFGTGKWHNGPRSYARSFTDGASIFFGGMEDHWNVPQADFDPTGNYELKPYIEDPSWSSLVEFRPCDRVMPGKHSSELFADVTIDFLNGYDRSAPFFAYVSFMAPHDPRTMPSRFLEMYDPESIQLPENVVPEHPFDNGALQVRDEQLAAWPRSNEEIRRHLADYYAMISHLDAEIGRILESLEENGYMDNTIIVLAGDNGLAIGQHGLMGKQNSYEHSLKVPLLISGPGIPANEKRDALVYLLDIFPTLCELAGVPVPETVEGASLLSTIRSETPGPRESLFAAYASYQRAVRNARFKLIEYAVEGVRRTQLFDLLDDPAERRNLAELPDYASELSRLRAELVRWRDVWDDAGSPWGAEFWHTREDLEIPSEPTA